MNQSPLFLCSIVSEFDFSSDEYQALYAVSDATVFQQPSWLEKLQTHACSTALGKVQTLLIREQDTQQLILALPLLLRRKGPLRLLEFLNMGFVDYAASIYNTAFLDELIRQSGALSAEIDSILPSHDLLWIKHIHATDQILLHLFPKAHQLNANFDSHRTELTGSFEDWRKKTMSKKRRGNLRRARQKLLEEGSLRSQLVSNPDEIMRAFSSLRAFRHLRFSENRRTEHMQNQSVFEFYLHLAQQGARDGSTRTYQLLLDDVCIAVAFGLCHEEEYIYLLPGADFKRYGRHSPGVILLEDMICDLMKDGFGGFDFSIGDEAYKMQFGTYPVAIQTLARPQTLTGHGVLRSIKFLKNYQQKRSLQQSDGKPAMGGGTIRTILASILGPEKG